MKLRRIISLATLAISIFTLCLVLKRPAPVAGPAASAATVAANAQSFQEKISQLEQPKSSAELSSEVRINSAELSAALAQASGLMAPRMGVDRRVLRLPGRRANFWGRYRT